MVQISLSKIYFFQKKKTKYYQDPTNFLNKKGQFHGQIEVFKSNLIFTIHEPDFCKSLKVTPSKLLFGQGADIFRNSGILKSKNGKKPTFLSKLVILTKFSSIFEEIFDLSVKNEAEIFSCSLKRKCLKSKFLYFSNFIFAKFCFLEN